jgi:hypothetical protein
MPEYATARGGSRAPFLELAERSGLELSEVVEFAEAGQLSEVIDRIEARNKQGATLNPLFDDVDRARTTADRLAELQLRSSKYPPRANTEQLSNFRQLDAASHRHVPARS